MDTPLSAEERKAKRQELLARVRERRQLVAASSTGRTPPRSPTASASASNSVVIPALALGGQSTSSQGSAPAVRVSSSAMNRRQSHQSTTSGAGSGSAASIGHLNAPPSRNFIAGSTTGSNASPVRRVPSRSGDQGSPANRSFGGTSSSGALSLSRAEREEKRRRIAERTQAAMNTKLPEGFEQDLSHIQAHRQKSSTRSRSRTGSHAGTLHDDNDEDAFSDDGNYNEDLSNVFTRAISQRSLGGTSITATSQRSIENTSITSPQPDEGLKGGGKGFVTSDASPLAPGDGNKDYSPGPDPLVNSPEPTAGDGRLQDSPEPAAPALPATESEGNNVTHHHASNGVVSGSTHSPSSTSPQDVKKGSVRASEGSVEGGTTTDRANANRALLDEFDGNDTIEPVRDGSASTTAPQPSPPAPARDTLPPDAVIGDDTSAVDAINRNSSSQNGYGTAGPAGASGAITTNDTTCRKSDTKNKNKGIKGEKAAAANENNPLYGEEPKRKCCCKCCPLCCDKCCCIVM